MNPTIQVTINPDGVSCREVNPFGKKPREINAPEYWAGFDDDEVKEARSEYEINQREIREWNEAESTLRTFEIEYPEIKIGDIIWGENRRGNPSELQVIGNDSECDAEAQICLMDIDQETNLLWLPGTTHTAEILPNNKVKILS